MEKKLLKNWLPHQLDTFDLKVEKFLDYEVVHDIGHMENQENPSKFEFPFTHNTYVFIYNKNSR